MSDNLRRLRDAVVSRGREVEVTPTGEVRDATREPKPDNDKPTKLAPRTFGA